MKNPINILSASSHFWYWDTLFWEQVGSKTCVVWDSLRDASPIMPVPLEDFLHTVGELGQLLFLSHLGQDSLFATQQQTMGFENAVESFWKSGGKTVCVIAIKNQHAI